MLAYVDALCAALLARDKPELERLLALPLAMRLPARVREEAMAVVRGRSNALMAPVHALHFYYRLTHLAGDTEPPDIAPAEEHGSQIELSLRAVNG